MAVVFPFFLVLLLIVLALVIGLVVIVACLARAEKAGPLVVLLIGGGLFVMVFLVFVALFTARVSHQVPMLAETAEPRAPSFQVARIEDHSTPVTEPQPANGLVVLDGNVVFGWDDQADQHFNADVYPSIEAASASLARRLRESLAGLSQEPRELSLSFVGIEGEESSRVGGATERALHDAMPVMPLRFHVASGEDVSVLHIHYEPASESEDAAYIRWRLEQWDIKLSAAVRNKPWVILGSSIPRLPDGGAGLVTHSQGLFGSLIEADRDATTQLAERYRTVLSLDAMARPDLEQTALGDQSARRAISSAIQQHGLIQDRFVQRIERPYGELYRVALLADASPSALHHVTEAVGLEAARTAKAATQERSRQRHQVVSVGALLLLVVLVYGVLNALTKHYFLWPLRAAALMVLIVGLLATLMNI